MTALTIGSRVSYRAVSGSPIRRVGTVVEADVASGRYRVKWEQYLHDDGSTKPFERNLRTWVRRAALTPVPGEQVVG